MSNTSPTADGKTTGDKFKGEKITGEFFAVKPLDEFSICIGLTTLIDLPVFIAQIKKNEAGEWIFGNKIALTRKESSAVIQFFDAMRSNDD